MMTLENYLAEYKESHQNSLNIKIHYICVPLIMWSLLGLLHTIPVGENSTPLSYILAALGVMYYISLKNLKVVAAMIVVTLLMVASFDFITNLRAVSVVVFVLAWIGQFYGHKVEGKKPSFFKDLLFLLIGPVWIMKKIFPKWM